MVGNQCPSICGSTWKKYDPDSNSPNFVSDPAISVTCIGMERTNELYKTLYNFSNLQIILIITFTPKATIFFKFYCLIYLDNPGHCNNSVQDGDESGVDCGGVTCPSCPGKRKFSLSTIL